MLKLSTNQQEIVQLMRDGYILHYNGITHHYWLKKIGNNDSHYRTNVHKSTIKALNRKNLLRQTVDAFPVREYALAVKGKTEQIQ
jgi:hypothetical protein